MKLHLLVIVVLVLLCDHQQQCDAQSCKTVDQLDDCAFKSAFFINRQIQLPRSIEEMKGHCATAHSSIDCLSEFNENCVVGPPQILLRKVYSTVREGLNERCNDDDKAYEFVENLRCLDTEEKIEAVRMCSDKHVKLLEKVGELDFGRRTGPMCCAFQAYKQCAMERINEVCPPDQANYFQSILMEYSDELATISCEMFSTMEKCAANVKPNIWATLKPIIDSKEKIEHKYKTAVPIMYRMIKPFIKD